MQNITPPENSVFSTKTSINCKGKLLNLEEPKVMGIINITPDSFYDGGKNNSLENALRIAEKMIDEGVDIFDIGGSSTRPGSDAVSIQEELDRIIPIIEKIHHSFPETPISVDTYHSTVCRETVNSGASIINDISGGQLDEKLFETVANLNVPYILMHMKGKPKNMQENPHYDHLEEELFLYFSEKLNHLRTLGVKDIILDPGFGFGKTLSHNYQLLKKLHHFLILGCPILAGASRKGMIWRLLKSNPQNALNGTTVINTLALLGGAKILRVHDVKEAREAIQIVRYFQKQ